MIDSFYVVLSLLIVLGILGGSICGIVVAFKLGKFNDRIYRLEQQLLRLGYPARDPDAPPESPREPAEEPSSKEFAATTTDAPSTPVKQYEPDTRMADDESPDRGTLAADFVHLVRDNWMIWLGGFCVALAGIFLAIYTIEQGLLGPTGRVILGIITGIALHAGAEYLRHRTGTSHPALGALAGAGSITLFATILSALHLYALINPTVAFICLAAVALVTMWMALVHGPVLAAFGILGAYLVPVVVATDEGQILIALVYSVIISASALLLLRYIYRNWLWWGFIIGALGWWWISIPDAGADGARGFYLFALGYMILALPTFNWKLTQVVRLPEESWHLLNFFSHHNPQWQIPASFMLLIIAQGISILVEPAFFNAIFLWSPLVLLTLVAARYQEPLNYIPWCLLLVQAVAWLLPQANLQDNRVSLELLTAPEDIQAFWYLGITSLLFSGCALANFVSCRFKAIWASLAALAPVLLLLVCYLLTTRSLVSLEWGILTAMIAMVYLGLATASIRKQTPDTLVIWLFFGGHFALSLAAVMVFEAATLTLAFAVQMISTAWIIKQFNLPSLGWILKIVVAIVIIRLTFNPWLAGYNDESHWTLWTYGGATGCGVIAVWLLRQWPIVSRWAEGAALHLFVLTLWSELRYWLYDGSVFENDYTALEAGIYVLLFGTLSLVYYRRSLLSQNLKRIYRIFSGLLALMALFNYAAILISTLFSSPWITDEISQTPLLNLMLLLYGAPVILGVLYLFFHVPRVRSLAAAFSGVAAFIFISLQIRHLWQDTVSLHNPTSSGELYTYSAVWLVMAIATILSGAWKLGIQCYRAGMILLALVIAKIFIVDMSDLEGLLRVASFMGLGLALLGISFLHQRIQHLQN